jgi:hypothetical protein
MNAAVSELYKYPTNSAYNIINITEDRHLEKERYLMFYDGYERYSIEDFTTRINKLDNRINLLLIGTNKSILLNLANKLIETTVIRNVFILKY